MRLCICPVRASHITLDHPSKGFTQSQLPVQRQSTSSCRPFLWCFEELEELELSVYFPLVPSCRPQGFFSQFLGRPCTQNQLDRTVPSCRPFLWCFEELQLLHHLLQGRDLKKRPVSTDLQGAVAELFAPQLVAIFCIQDHQSTTLYSAPHHLQQQAEILSQKNKKTAVWGITIGNTRTRKQHQN